MLKIKFTTGNAAFDSTDKGVSESTRLLKKIIADMDSGYEDGIVLDINGNKIGEWSYEYDGVPELPTEVMYDRDQFHSHYDDELYEEVGDKLTCEYGYHARSYEVDPCYIYFDGRPILSGYHISEIKRDI